MSLSKRDQKIIWHPFTQAQTAEPPLPISRGKGVYLYDDQDNAYLDLISSWWVNLHGHGHPKIAEAIYQQALQLEHVIFAGFTHDPAVMLCESLKRILPPSLNRFFFSDNGSTAVEIALKIAYQYWLNHGQDQRHRFLSFDGAYHGDTFGAMSIGKGSGFHTHFQKLFFQVETIPYPATWIDDTTVEEKEENALRALKIYLEKHAHETAAFIAEPLMQGASGMRLCRPQFLQIVIDLLRAHDILIVFDEVMTGFGRTGTFFAADQVERAPDIICLSKGLTGGFLPLSLTVVQEKIYDAFLGTNFDKAFAHGHSYTANPLGCAAALASFHLLIAPETMNQINLINQIHQQRLKRLWQDFSTITAPRHLGTIAAFELSNHHAQYGHASGKVLQRQFMEKGLLIRPLGNVVYLMPPYCITQKELHHTYDEIEAIFGL